MAHRSMNAQTVKPDKWVVVLEYEPKWHLFKMPQPCEVEVLRAPEKMRLSNLNASLNEGLRHIDSDYVIFYQDFIELQEDCFEKLLDLADPQTLVTTCTPTYDGADDGRYTGANAPRPCRPDEWEANVAIAPMKLLRELGGFEERLDHGWSWDNVHLAKRAAMLGASFVLDESNRPKLHDHEQTSKLSLTPNGEFCTRDIAAIRAGRRPVRLSYLQ
jgi:hypothetical protein